MPTPHNPLIKKMNPSVQKDCNISWFNRIVKLFDRSNPNHIYGERIGHLILHAHSNKRFTHITEFLSDHFPDSLILVKEEVSKETTKAIRDKEEEVIIKDLHYHCYITYKPSGDVNPDASFRSKVREILKNKGREKNFHKEDSSYRFRAYNVVTSAKWFGAWDVFYNSYAEHLEQGTDYKCLSLPVTEDTKIRILSWVSYAAKKTTSRSKRNCRILDNRNKHVK